MRLLFFSTDLGPALNLMRVAKAALESPHQIGMLGNVELAEKPLLDLGVSFGPDVLLTGLSSFKNTEELALGRQASQAGTPWVILADTHRSWARESARGKIGEAILIIASPAEADAARAFGYARVEYLGGPPTWQDYPLIRPVALQRRNPQSKVILVGGIKDAAITDRMLGEVTASCHELLGERWELVFKPHPNEDKGTQDPARREKILASAKVIETTVKSQHLLGAVDVSVFTGGATDTIAGAYLRAPMIFFEDDEVRARNLKQVGEPTWFPAEAGACLKAGVTTSDPAIWPTMPMKDAISALLTEDGRNELRERQERIYPQPAAPGEPVESRILKFLSELTGKPS